MSDILSVPAPQPGVKPTNFHFTLDRFPNTTFMAQVAAIPAVNFDRVVFNTPVQDINLPSTGLNYEDFQITLLMDKNLQVYAEMFSWLRGLSIQDSRSDYANFIEVRRRQMGIKTESRITEETAQGILIAMDGNSVPTFKFIFDNMFPVAMSPLEFNTEDAGIEYMKCTVTFAYTGFNLEPITDGALDGIENAQAKYSINLF